MKEFVFIKPGQEEIFIAKALDLAISELVFVYDYKDMPSRSISDLHSFQKEGLRVFFGVLVDKKYQIPPHFTIQLILGTKSTSLFSGITHIYFNEGEPEKDFIHQRRSGFNHVFMQECVDKEIQILTSYVALQEASDSRRAQLLGRMTQNKMLAQKKGVSYTLVSGATSSDQLRNPKDVNELFETL